MKKVTITVPICGYVKKEIEVPENATIEECFDVFMEESQNVNLLDNKAAGVFSETSIDYVFETHKGNFNYLDVNRVSIEDCDNDWDFEDDGENE